MAKGKPRWGRYGERDEFCTTCNVRCVFCQECGCVCECEEQVGDYADPVEVERWAR